MARYIKWDDVVLRYRQFSDIVDDADAEEVYIAPAEAMVDALLAKSYAVPFSASNLIVKDLAINVAFAKSQMFKDTEKATAIMGHVSSITHMLNMGMMVMVDSGGVVVEQSVSNVWAETEDYTPVFGMGDITDFTVDSSRLFDEGTERE